MERSRLTHIVKKVLSHPSWRTNPHRVKTYQCRNSFERAIYHQTAERIGLCSSSLVSTDQYVHLLDSTMRSAMDHSMERIKMDSTYSREIQALHRHYDVKRPVTYVQIYSPDNPQFQKLLILQLLIPDLTCIVTEYMTGTASP